MGVSDPIQQGKINWIQHANGNVGPISTATALIRGSQVIQASSAAVVPPSEVTSAQLEVLVALESAEIPASLTGLARALSLHPTTVARTVNRLARRGYAVRSQDPEDGRVAVLNITPTGRSVVVRALTQLKTIKFGLAGWDTDEAERFIKLVAPILDTSSSPTGLSDSSEVR